MDLFSINPVTGGFDDVGDLLVSVDGLTIQTISGGVLNSSWHFATPQPGGGPTPNPVPPADNPNNENNGCDRCKRGHKTNSFVESHSGVLLEFHDLATYQSLCETRGVTLTYDSQRADPRHIIHTGFTDAELDALTDAIARDRLRLMADINISRGNFDLQVPGFGGGQLGLDGGENFWTLPDQPGDVDGAVQVDLSNQPTGKFDYGIASGIVLRSDFTGAFVGTLNTFTDKILNVNSINSPFGSDGVEEEFGNSELVFRRILESKADHIFAKEELAATYLQWCSFAKANGNEARTKEMYDSAVKLIDEVLRNVPDDVLAKQLLAAFQQLQHGNR